MRKYRFGEPTIKEGSGFGDIMESKKALGPAVAGKKVVFAVDDKDLHIETTMLKYAVFEAVGASDESRAVGYSEFFANPGFQADVLVLRSSRMMGLETDKLKRTLESFRARNPASAVIVGAYEGSVVQALLPLVDSGIINGVDSCPPNDIELLRAASAALDALRK
ncbi:MAG: hypothetical protein AB1529_00975 [Candidatus Micrarchaeota archaeon]